MTAMFRSWWQQIKQHPVAFGFAGIILAVAIALIIAVVRFNGTGFDGYYQVTTARTISGTNAGTVVRTEVYQPGKALWDWMQLLIIPAAIAVGVWWLNRLQQQRDQQLADQRAQTEREIALDNQREAALKEYFDKMSELLLHESLRKAGGDDEVRKIARVWTLTAIRRLDGERKGSMIRFLHEANLINKDNYFVDLRGADLKGANLEYAHLEGARLRGVHLEFASLQGAYLEGANLLGVRGITREELERQTSFLEGATMPDGSTHA